MSSTQTASAVANTNETRNPANARAVVWVDLPTPADCDSARLAPGVYDPSALYEDLERWDGMA
jgi:hypothetical protein